MKTLIYILCALALCLSSCAAGANRESSATASPSSPANSGANERKDETAAGGAAGGGAAAQADNKTFAGGDRTACLNLKIPGRRVDAKQTFAIDFAPFPASCFVTAHDPEFTDPPLGSEFFIYRDGREVFRLPNQFNGTTTGCWAEAVAFQDLNGDRLTDVVIAGMCSAKTAPYSENMVYVNTGTALATDEQANLKLNDFKKIKDITDFVKRNQEQFFK